MPNSIYQQLNNNSGNYFQNSQNLINQFNEFRKNLQGDPQQIIQQLLQSGKMSQAQLNYLQSMAFEFQKILPKISN